MQGRIIKLISSSIMILGDDGFKYEARVSGKVKNKHRLVLGDLVVFHQEKDCYIVDELLARKSYLIRPNVANVDQALIVMSLKEPEFDEVLVNRLIIQIETANIKPIILITKCDLDDGGLKAIIDKYQAMGYSVYTNHQQALNKQLLKLFKGKITVLAGQSGVGKTSLINQFLPQFQLRTQQISKSLNRGKHTTTHFEFFELGGGMLADTPGFSSLEYYGDLKTLLDKLSLFKLSKDCCKYGDCKHINEPLCAVKDYISSHKECEVFYNCYKEIIIKKEKNQKW
ncbi:MAG: ribosome small subunit-dependent GTPase A [Erysipelotrichaceae bacterium]|nr:ribosome small subunit-dependent GTPase A [Erysipelotrichaceae bacterium]